MSINLHRVSQLSRQHQLLHLQRCAAFQRATTGCDDLHQPFLPRTRQHGFSTTRPRRAEAPKKEKPKSAMAAKMEKAKAEALRQGNIPDDNGLLADTFLMPYGKNRPSWSGQFKQRLKLERARGWARLIDAYCAVLFKFFLISPRPKLNLGEIPGVASELHQKMSNHFAANTLEPLQHQICPGFMSSLRSRVSMRPSNTHLRWTLYEYKSKPKLASWKMQIMPKQAGETKADAKGIVQAVVRIHSVQSLQRVKRVPVRDDRRKGESKINEVLVDAQGEQFRTPRDAEEDARRNAKELVEYVVVQKMVKNGQPGPWKIWGMAEEMTMAKLERKLQMEQRKKKSDKGAAGVEPVS